MEQKKILIIEDDESVQEILKLLLIKAGFEIEVSADGKSVFMERNSWPDLILLDKHLLGNDGLEICKFLKSHNSTKRIPVIMLSATPGIEPLAREAGADDFLEKPFNSAVLMSKIQQYFHATFEKKSA